MCETVTRAKEEKGTRGGGGEEGELRNFGHGSRTLRSLLRLWTSGVRPACDGPSARALRTTDKHISPLPSVLSNPASVRHVLQHCPLAPMTPPHHASPPAHLTAAGHASPGPQPKAAGALHRTRALLLRLAASPACRPALLGRRRHHGSPETRGAPRASPEPDFQARADSRPT